MEYGETVYVNQGKMGNLVEVLGEFIAKKYNVSQEAGEYALSLIFADKLREDEYEPDDVPELEELKRAHFIW